MNNLKKYIDFNNYEKERINYPILKDCPQQFIDFLKNENVYEKFIDNLLKVSNHWKKNIWRTSIFCDINKVDYIFSGFKWSKTDDRYDFWKNINNKWKEIIYKNE
jgi:hypothetical protein